jgi:hypothetical protein
MPVFVDTDSDIRLIRRIRRDLEQRGRSFQSVRDQYYACFDRGRSQRARAQAPVSSGRASPCRVPARVVALPAIATISQPSWTGR